MEKNEGELKLALCSAPLLSAIHHSCVPRMFSNPFLIPLDEDKVYVALIFHLFFLEQMLYPQCMHTSDLFQKASVIWLYGLSIFSFEMCGLIRKQLALEIM